MSVSLGLANGFPVFGAYLPAAFLAHLERDLHSELSRIEYYEETLRTFDAMQADKLKSAFRLNLASPYAVPVRFLRPPRDANAWSFVTVRRIAPCLPHLKII
jgi:hypothetical protein